MYELEVSHQWVSLEDIPVDILSSFTQAEKHAMAMTLLPWEEHCTECAMPMCYSSCGMYESRADGKCRRFVGGIVPVSAVNSTQGYVTRVSFKRWGQLMAYGNLHLIPMAKLRRIEKAIYIIDSVISRLPGQSLSIKGRSGITSRMWRRFKQFIAAKGFFSDHSDVLPDYLLLEVYNPSDSPINLTLTIGPRNQEAYSVGYQELLSVAPEFNRFEISIDKIARIQNLSDEINISLNPNIIEETDEGITLYFGTLAFVRQDQEAKAGVNDNSLPYVKVVVWDLDNTLWDGVLVEDGLEHIRLKPDVMKVIKELDSRGILNSVVSKNNHDDAMKALEYFDLSKYMLYPQIGWEQKGKYIKSLVQQFNVGANTFAFVDDQPFERDEVHALNPQVRVYDAVQYDELLGLSEFNPPLSSESHLRRKLYKVASQRTEALSGFDGDYVAFLKECEIELVVSTPSPASMGRIMELVQRTNQLNFSGNRYAYNAIEEIITSKRYDTYTLDCSDRYGHYGTVGFGVVDKDACKLIDLMFSCRVQSKRVEHAFMSFLLDLYKSRGEGAFSAVYIKTDRNVKAGAVFEDMKFIPPQTNEEHVYRYPLDQKVPNDNIINVIWQENAAES